MDKDKARICWSNGEVSGYEDQALAYAVWLGLPKGTRCAFRGKGDNRPIYPWDYVDTV